jgi:hypothetical protein
VRDGRSHEEGRKWDLTDVIMKTLCFFSSPMVNLPCVCLLFSAKACSFLTAGLDDTETANLTLAFVYSWPGWGEVGMVLVPVR